MKEKITAFVLAMIIALGLSACDGTKTGTATNDNDVMGDEHSNVQQQVPGNTDTNNTDTNNTDTNDTNTNGTGTDTDAKNRSSTYAGGSYRNNSGSTYGNSGSTYRGNGGTYGNSGSTYRSNGGVSNYSTTNPANGYRQTTTWWKMLQNGRVHDSDGFLMDGENAHWE